MRKCRLCNKTLSIGADGVMCITCRSIPPVHRPATTRQIGEILPPIKDFIKHAEFISRYGLSGKKQKELWQQQKGKCAICDCKQFLVLDHNHNTEQARGFLCKKCNIMLSGFDDPDFMGRAKEYLDNSPVDNLE